MSHCVEKLPHSCGSSDGLQVFEDNQGKISGYCFACQTYVPDPYDGGERAASKRKRKEKSPEEVEAELQEIDSLEAFDLPERKLRRETLEHFGIRVGLSEYDGSTPAFHFYLYTKDGKRQGYKTRLIHNKAMWSVGTLKGADLFGWEQAKGSGAKRLFITEGELDCAALYQALKDNSKGGKWEHLEPAVVSLRAGATHAVADIQAQWAEIRRLFKEVVLVFDEDEAGKKAVDAVTKAFPTIMAAKLPAKDANACLIEGRNKALCAAVLFNASAPKNTRVVSGTSLVEAARKAPEYGVSWPFVGLTKLTRGIRKGETYYLGAGVKMGKSEVVNTLAKHLIIEHDWKVFLAKPEESNVKTMQLLAGKVAGKFFHDPDKEFDEKAYDEAAAKVANNFWVLDLYQHMGWDELKEDIRYAVNTLGVDAVFIDPITNLVNGKSAADQNTHLQEIAQELSALAKDLNIAIFIFCHLKAPESGPSHERGGEVFSSQFAGSRAMMRSCNYMLALEGNKDPKLTEEQRNQREIVLLEDREFGQVGRIKLYWDHNTGLFNEV